MFDSFILFYFFRFFYIVIFVDLPQFTYLSITSVLSRYYVILCTNFWSLHRCSHDKWFWLLFNAHIIFRVYTFPLFELFLFIIISLYIRFCFMWLNIGVPWKLHFFFRMTSKQIYETAWNDTLSLWENFFTHIQFTSSDGTGYHSLWN